MAWSISWKSSSSESPWSWSSSQCSMQSMRSFPWFFALKSTQSIHWKSLKHIETMSRLLWSIKHFLTMSACLNVLNQALDTPDFKVQKLRWLRWLSALQSTSKLIPRNWKGLASRAIWLWSLPASSEKCWLEADKSKAAITPFNHSASPYGSERYEQFSQLHVGPCPLSMIPVQCSGNLVSWTHAGHTVHSPWPPI